jgi:hypothetical protein
MSKLFGLWLALATLPAFGTDVIPAAATDKIGDTPDLMQSLPAAGLPDAGAAHCGPVAVSNSLVWLARHGYPQLAPSSNLTATNHGALARLLGETRYMHTTYQDGTTVDGMLTGVAKYLADRNTPFKYLGYQGWDTSTSPYDTGIKIPELQWITAGLTGKSAVWLKIGWYRQLGRHEWQKFAGHWVTLVGHGVDAHGNAAPDILIVHDPAPRSGEQLSTDYVKLIPLERGTLRSISGRRSIPTTGLYRLGGDLKIKDGADFGALDAAVVLKMQ